MPGTVTCRETRATVLAISASGGSDTAHRRARPRVGTGPRAPARAPPVGGDGRAPGPPANADEHGGRHHTSGIARMTPCTRAGPRWTGHPGGFRVTTGKGQAVVAARNPAETNGHATAITTTARRIGSMSTEATRVAIAIETVGDDANVRSLLPNSKIAASWFLAGRGAHSARTAGDGPLSQPRATTWSCVLPRWPSAQPAT
mmetsp:Transcript_17920/g.56689  ORF Transcript_17920/g.56689 Transcript_17920/m.56689 type:complete len:202 (+) Transcript_17920:269-874(+)|eukprot:scaffold2036_cov115-Isochrysis_galbana.AAC.9